MSSIVKSANGCPTTSPVLVGRGTSPGTVSDSGTGYANSQVYQRGESNEWTPLIMAP